MRCCSRRTPGFPSWPRSCPCSPRSPASLGQPSERYPHPWIVTTWVPGTPADHAPATCSGPAADALAAFLTALHRPAPVGAPEGRGRGGALTQVAKGIARQFKAMTDLCTAVAEAEQEPTPDPDAVRAIWDDAVAAPGWEGPPLWLHGDLHPANVFTADGNFCGVVDFGDLCAGDPVLDLPPVGFSLPITRRSNASGRPTRWLPTTRPGAVPVAGPSGGPSAASPSQRPVTPVGSPAGVRQRSPPCNVSPHQLRSDPIPRHRSWDPQSSRAARPLPIEGVPIRRSVTARRRLDDGPCAAGPDSRRSHSARTARPLPARSAIKNAAARDRLCPQLVNATRG
jgi:Phosphotransferase enzyme family